MAIGGPGVPTVRSSCRSHDRAALRCRSRAVEVRFDAPADGTVPAAGGAVLAAGGAVLAGGAVVAAGGAVLAGGAVPAAG